MVLGGWNPKEVLDDPLRLEAQGSVILGMLGVDH